MANADGALTRLDFGTPGVAFRSPMPFSDFDPESEAFAGIVEAGVSRVVMLTGRREHERESRKDLPRLYAEAGISLVHIETEDYGIPADRSRFDGTVRAAAAGLRAGDNLAAHCLAGVGRTGMFLACLARELSGLGGDEALEWVRRQVPGAVQTAAQERVVRDYRPSGG